VTLSAGTKLGPYEILSPLGAGGMGEVYKATDTRLGRDVAIKTLPDRFSRDTAALARFEREVRALAALSHVNILVIHDVGNDGGVAYAVTELLDGETLRQRLAVGALPVRRAVDLAVQISEGLAAAHAKGVVHRDLKPENVFVGLDGRAKILDFGLARELAPLEGANTESRTAEMVTEPGTTLGTVGYMAPEQVRGQPADGRSDIFALGCVLYEMLAGQRAFTGASAVETLNAVLNDDPPELETANPSVPQPLARLVRRCLEKRPDERFQVARDLAFALEALAGAGALTRAGFSPRGADTRAGPPSLAVLPLKDLGRDPASAHLGLGLADATITELSLLKSLLVRPTASIAKYGDRSVDPLEAGRELGVDAVVDGSFQRAGSRLRVTVQLIETAGGRSLWGAKIDTSLEDLFDMQDEVSRKIAEALEVELSPREERLLGRGPRATGGAYDLYMKGRYHLLGESLENVNKAIESFERARDLDPSFAPVWAGLADTFVRMAFVYEPDGGWYERAEEMCAQALRLDPSLPEGHYVRARLLWSPQKDFDHGGALRELSSALAGQPNLSEAHVRQGIVLGHVAMFEESEKALKRALDISPDDPSAALHLGLCRLLECRYAEALELTDRAVRKAPSPWAHYQLALCQVRLGLLEQASETAEASSRRYPGDVLFQCVRGLVAASRGDAGRAHQHVRTIVEKRKAFGHYHHAQYDIACIQSALGDRAAAFASLEAAAHNGFPCYRFFEGDSLLEPVRGEPGFGGLMTELRNECARYRSIYVSAEPASDVAGGRPAGA
jgi:TolB-like protein